MLTQLAAVHGSIEARGGAVIGIAPASAAQAENLMGTTVPFQLLMDPDQLVGARIGLGTQSFGRFVLNMPAWWRYLKAFFSGNWQRRITGHYSNLPGVCVIDAHGNVMYVYTGSGLGDYPPLETVLDELDALLHR
jgi:peroxiredoxin